MMKQVLLLLIFTAMSVCAHAQKYVVYSMTNTVEYVRNGKVRHLKEKDVLTPQDMIVIPYSTRLELIDKASKRRFIIRTPGKGRVDGFVKDSKNEVSPMSTRMFDVFLNWLTSETTNREGHSDTATVTLEEFADSTVVVVGE